MSDKLKLIQIHVKFASSDKKPYHEAHEPDMTVEQLLAAVMTYFEAATDGTTRYFLKFDGREVSGTETIGALATNPDGQTRALQMSIITETVSG